MTMHRFFNRVPLLLLSLVLPVAAQAEIPFAVIEKEQFFVQQGPLAEDVVPDGSDFGFSVAIAADSQSDLSSPSYRIEGGVNIALEWDSEEGEGYVFDGASSTLENLNEQYPAGDYFITFTPSGGSQVSKAVSVLNTLPNKPVIENYFDLRHFPVNEPVTVQWAPLAGGGAEDVISLEVVEPNDWTYVFETGVHYFGDEGALDGTATQATIPAGTLEMGQDYELLLGFNQFVTVDNGQTLSGTIMGSIGFSETYLSLRPVTRHPSSVISWGLLSRSTTHRQIGPVTVQPVAGDEAAYFYASIWLDNPNDLSTARAADNLMAKESNGDGWSYFQPVAGEEMLEFIYPNDAYELFYGFAAGGSHFTTLELTGGLLPAVQLTNWSALQAASSGAVTMIEWTAPENVRATDLYNVKINDSNGELVFETDLDLQAGIGLNGTDTSVAIPAGTLTEGEVHDASISYFRVTDMDRNSQADAFFIAANAVETRFTINTGAASGDPVAVGAVGREVYYTQTGPGAPVLDLQDDEQFGALAVLFGDSVHELASASVRLPGGTVFPMEYDGQDNEFGAFETLASFDQLVAAFPAGEYTLGYQITGGAQVENTLTLGETFPGVPHVSNWAATQSVNASEDFTITWDPIEGMTETDGIAIYVDDPMGGGGDLFEREVRLIDPSGLLGTAQSVTIPAGTLEPNRTYEVTLDALKFTEIDESNEGQVFVAFNMHSTGFNLVTGSGNQPPSIATGSLGDADEGQAFAATVNGSDPEDGFAVSLRAPVLPSWLTFVDQGSGEGTFSGTPSAANVGVFTVTVEVADTQGLTSVREYALTVNPDLSDPEGRALDIASINWLRDQASPFEAQIADVQHGESALISGSVGDGATSFLQGTFTGPIQLSFYWKVSSQAESDFFRIKVDDAMVAEISGEQNWRQQIISLPAGNHSVVWAYEKDGSGSSGADRGWVDHVTILPADAGVYAGTYLGGIASSTGEVALYIRPNNKAVFLGYHPESGKGLSNFSFDVSDTGAFSFEVVNPDDMNANYTVTGSISGGVASGTVSGLNLSFTADLVSGGGQLVSYDGYYQNALTATTSGLVYLIVATDGQAYFFAEDGSYVEGFITTIDAAGNIVLMTDQGFDYDLTVDPSTDIVAGSYTPPGGETSNILGIREGSPGDELLANISTRGQVLGGDKVMIASFVITGSGSKRLLIRAIGPRLADFGVGGILPDPAIDLIRLGETVPMSSNNNWSEGEQTALLVSESARLGAFGLNSGGLDSVLLLSLEPGAYTATVKGNGGTTGVGLVEVYDADDPAERVSTADVVNIATRGQVGTGGDVLIAGFVVSGDVPKRVLIRGIGPQLALYGVGGVLEDPRIDLVDNENNVIASNNDWSDNADLAAVVSSITEVGAFALEEGSKDAVLLIWLPPGAYTAKVSGADGGTGVALIEVYDN